MTSRTRGWLTETGGGGVSATGGAVELHPASTPATITSPPLLQKTGCRPIILVPFFCFPWKSDHMLISRLHQQPGHRHENRLDVHPCALLVSSPLARR